MSNLDKIINALRDRVEHCKAGWGDSRTRFEMKVNYGEYIYLTALTFINELTALPPNWEFISNHLEDLGTEIFESIVSQTQTIIKSEDEFHVPFSAKFSFDDKTFYFVVNYEEHPETYKAQTDWSSAANLILLRDAIEAITGLTVHRK